MEWRNGESSESEREREREREKQGVSYGLFMLYEQTGSRLYAHACLAQTAAFDGTRKIEGASERRARERE